MPGPSNPTLVTRKLGSVPFTSGGRNSLELDKNGVLLGLKLRLRYTVTNGATGPVGPLFQTLARLINRVELMAAGRDIVQSIPGYFLAARAQLEQECPGYGMDATVVLTANAVTSYDIILPMDLTLPLGARDDDTGLDTTGFNQLSLITTFGKTDASDLFTTPNGAVLSNVSLDVEGTYIPNPMRDQNGVAVSGVTGKPYMVRHLDYQEVLVPATNNSFAVILDNRTGLIDLSFSVIALADDVASDAIVNSVKIDAGSWNYALRDAAFIRADNRRYLKTPGAYYQTGMLYIEPRFQGSLVNAINSAELAGDLKATFDLTKQGATTKLGIQREAMRSLVK